MRKLDDRARRTKCAARQLIGLRDPHDFADALDQLDSARIEIRVYADGAQHGLGLAGRAMHIETIGDQAVNHMLVLLVACARLHHRQP